MLAHRKVDPAGTARATLVLLHAGGGGADDLIALGQSLGGDLILLAPEAPSGRFDGRALIGHDWFRSDGAEIEPSSFGISLSLLEAFVTEHGAGPLFLVGQGDGACLALALLALAPELVAGVAAIGGRLPDLAGWGLVPQPLGGRPVLLIGGPDSAGAIAALGAVLTRADSSAVLRPWLMDVLSGGPVAARPMAGSRHP